MNKPVKTAVIKLGGSIVTDKKAGELVVRRDVVMRLAQEIHVARLESWVLVHGAGSFGHRIVKDSGIDAGLVGPQALLAWAETQRLQYVLAAQIAQVFIEAGIAVVPCQASASAVLSQRRLQGMDVEVARHLLKCGAVPQFYGVPAVDTQQGVSILSGDQIAPYLAHALGFDLVIHATDVDGVYDAEPRLPHSKPIEHIHQKNIEQVLKHVTGSSAVDVTGGMHGKLESLVRWAQQGVNARIVNANIPGRLGQVLAGQECGTWISWNKE